MNVQNARFYSFQCCISIPWRLFLQGFSHLHGLISGWQIILVILMKILWKMLDLYLLFVRYSFIMNTTLFVEESVRG